MRKFYIIARNPNDKIKAKEALKDGANALEPDIAFDDGKFWVYHKWALHKRHKRGDPTLKNYCSDLALILISNPDYNLALIAWDLKNVEDSGFDFWRIRDIIQINFLDELARNNYPEMPMLFTHATNYNYLLQEAAPYLKSNWALGIDQVNDPVLIDDKLRGHGFCYSYADGASPSRASVVWRFKRGSLVRINYN